MQHYALVSPMLQDIRFSNTQGDIWKLWAVSEKLTVWTGNFKLDVSHSSPFEVHLHNNLTYFSTCVKFPYSLMIKNWEWNVTWGTISCIDCYLTQCGNRTNRELIKINNYSLVIVKAHTELWVPVKLTHPCSDSLSVTHLYNAVQVLLYCSLQLIGIVIASFLAVASVTATAAIASVALHQDIQTANFMENTASRCSFNLATTKKLNSQLTTDVINLQHTVSWLGDQVTILATRSVLKCDWNSSHICVTPVPYNTSDSWEIVKGWLNGHQNLTLEIMNL